MVRAVHGEPCLACRACWPSWRPATPRPWPTDDPELALFQSPEVAHRGQWVAAVVATTLEGAREAADLLPIDYEAEDHDVVLRPDHRASTHRGGSTPTSRPTPRWATPEAVGGVARPHRRHLRDAAEHNHPMEPHATIAQWDGDRLTL